MPNIEIPATQTSTLTPGSDSGVRRYAEAMPASYVPALRNGMAVLRVLAEGPKSVASLMTRLGLPRSTTYHLLTELCTAGFARHLRRSKRYTLGPAFEELQITRNVVMRAVRDRLQQAEALLGDLAGDDQLTPLQLLVTAANTVAACQQLAGGKPIRQDLFACALGQVRAAADLLADDGVR